MIDTRSSYRIVQLDPTTYIVEWRKWWWPFYKLTTGPRLSIDGVISQQRCSEFADITQAYRYSIEHSRYRNAPKYKIIENLGRL